MHFHFKSSNSLLTLPDDIIRTIMVYSTEASVLLSCKYFFEISSDVFFRAKFLLFKFGTKNVFDEKIISHPWFNKSLALKLVQLGADVSLYNYRIIRWACSHSAIEILKFTFSSKKHSPVNINYNDNIFLQVACDSNDLLATRFILNLGVTSLESFNTTFLRASVNSELTIVSLLLDSGADVHFKDDFALRQASYNGNHDLVSLLIKYDANVHAFNESSLLSACHKGNYETVRVLLKHGANININSGAALRFSSSLGHLDIVELLIQNQIDLFSNNCGAKSLRDSAKNGHLEIVKLLIRSGISSSSLNDAAFLCASLNGHLNILKYLLENGSNPNPNSPIFRKFSKLRQQEVRQLLTSFGK